MKKTFRTIIMLLTITAISCNPEGAQQYSGLDDFSGTFKFNYKTPSSNKCPKNGITFSENDLEIFSDGRFKRKMYASDENNDCFVLEILEGKITITHPNTRTPRGIAEYDNSDMTENVGLGWSKNGKHNEINFGNDGSGVSFNYSRSY